MVDLERVEMMASGDPKWDLSPNDVTALKGVIAELRAARAVVAAAKELNERREKNYYFEWNTLEDRCSEYDRATKGDG